MSLKNPRNTKLQRQSLRREMTSSEELLWDRVRGKQLLGLRFKRQYGLGPYILDFYVPQVKLCIEVDGGIHNSKEVKEKDLNRDAFMNENGIRVLRFRNEEIENEIESVVEIIKREILKND